MDISHAQLTDKVAPITEGAEGLGHCPKNSHPVRLAFKAVC